MEDSKFNEAVKSQCYFCRLGASSISIYVPFGFLEQFITMCIRSGVSVSVVSTQTDVIL